MKFKFDHDYHIHSQLSLCSGDSGQTAQRLLEYAKVNNFKKLCVTDHYWDENVPGASDWYKPQNFSHINEINPLPEGGRIQFDFGCETDLDKHLTLGISKKMMDKFKFIVIPTTHLHMLGFTIDEADRPLERRAAKYCERLRAVLDMDLPFYKIGIAHLTCPLLAPDNWQDHIDVINMISSDEFSDIFKAAADKKVGIELNFNLARYTKEDAECILRPYRIAAAAGCKFYIGSDAHHPAVLTAAKERFEKIIDALHLEQEQKFDY